jgi:uncharacterized protein (DUF1501 family)
MFQLHTDCERFHRRDFLKIGTAGMIGLSLADLLRAEARAEPGSRGAKAKGVILVWLAGGPATIDMWDLKPEAPEGIRGEFKPIETSVPGVWISEHLPKTAKVMHHCTLVRSLNHPIPAHGPGTVYMTTGNKPTPALQYPALGSLTAKLLDTPKGVPPYVTFTGLRNGLAGGAGYLGTAFTPFEVEGLGGKGQLRVRGVSLPQGFALADLDNRQGLLHKFDQHFRSLDQSSDLAAGLDKFQQEALDILRSDRTKKAFDLNQEPDSLKDQYAKDAFGMSALAARRLIEAGVRFVTIGTGGWDTHNQNFQALKTRNLPTLDRTLATLISDLAERGLLENTIVYCAGEFGRTPKVNRTAGRDHWSRSMAVLLAGGGFKKGFVYGSTTEDGMAANLDPCTPDDIAATIFQQLGLDPHQELQTTTGRPVQLFREGKVIEKLCG